MSRMNYKGRKVKILEISVPPLFPALFSMEYIPEEQDVGEGRKISIVGFSLCRVFLSLIPVRDIEAL